jgi:hypothetical protein
MVTCMAADGDGIETVLVLKRLYRLGGTQIDGDDAPGAEGRFQRPLCVDRLMGAVKRTKTEMHDPRLQRAALVRRLAHGLRELGAVRQMRRHQAPNPKREWVRARSMPRSSASPFRRPMAG